MKEESSIISSYLSNKKKHDALLDQLPKNKCAIAKDGTIYIIKGYDYTLDSSGLHFEIKLVEAPDRASTLPDPIELSGHDFLERGFRLLSDFPKTIEGELTNQLRDMANPLISYAFANTESDAKESLKDGTGVLTFQFSENGKVKSIFVDQEDKE